MEESSLSRGERFGAARAAVMGSFDDRCLVSGAEVTLQGVASPGGSVNTSPFRQRVRGLIELCLQITSHRKRNHKRLS